MGRAEREAAELRERRRLRSSRSRCCILHEILRSQKIRKSCQRGCTRMKSTEGHTIYHQTKGNSELSLLAFLSSSFSRARLSPCSILTVFTLHGTPPAYNTFRPFRYFFWNFHLFFCRRVYDCVRERQQRRECCEVLTFVVQWLSSITSRSFDAMNIWK